MISLLKPAMRLIACVLIALSASACVPSSRSSAPLYYQPSLYGQQPSALYGMEYYALPRR